MERLEFDNLVSKAREGDETAKNALVRAVEPFLRAYVYRVTLDHDLTQDLSQEGLLEMFKSLGKLREVERFWPWLYGVAQSKICQHYRDAQKRAAISGRIPYEGFASRQADDREDDGLRRAVRDELSRTVMSAMREVRYQYRAVLSLRCFDGLSYADIGAALDCSELSARVTFFRARQALKRQLSRRGISKTLLVMCLGLFGKLTAPAEAASTCTVTAASTQVGLMAALVAAVGTKMGIATITAAIVAAGAVGGVAVLSAPDTPWRSQVSSFRYTMQSRNNDAGAVKSLSKGAYEQWHYFPEGIDGPVFTRMQRWTPDLGRKQCAWLQNEQGNYYYYAGEQYPHSSAKVYINNYRLWLSSLKVRRLPTDTPEFTSFLDSVEGGEVGVDYRRDRRTGLLTSAVDRRFADARGFQTAYEYNCLEPRDFEYAWPAEVAAVDQRDQMHKRGWTYFRMAGWVNEQEVSGRGRIPFVYRCLKENSPWLVLDCGQPLQVIDSANGACLRRSDGAVVRAYSAGAFFHGLSRPWMGIHTVDIIRRDAAAERIRFETAPAGDDKDVYVTLFDEAGGVTTTLRYLIDLENDIVKKIGLAVDGRRAGELRFSYLQEIDGAGDEFSVPGFLIGKRTSVRETPGISWLVSLAQDRLAD
ncbi:MAG: RNA polymerase sigma factor [Planctomycetota bacterium]